MCDIFHHNFKNIPCYVTSRAAKLYLSFSVFSYPKISILVRKSVFFRAAITWQKKKTFLPHMPAADLAFFPRGSIVHEPRSGEPIFFAILNPRKWCFPGIYAHITYPRARVAASRFFFAILNPRKWCFPGIYAHITYPRAA